MPFLPSRSRSRILLGAAALTAATIAVAGCATQAPEPGGAGADGDFSGQTLNALLITSHEGAGNWLKEHFEEETGAEVNLTIVPYDEIGSTLALDQQSGANTFDVAAPWYVSIGDLAEGGSIQDLTEWIDETPSLDTDDFIPSINDPYTLVGDRRYGLPFDGDTHVLFYNEEILERNGITEPPATWDEYLADVKTITENEGDEGVYGSAIFGQKSPLILGAAYANRLAGFGGEFVDDDGKPTINSREAVAAAEALVDAVPYAFPTAAETDFGVGNGAWYDGKVGFIENWTDLGVGSETNPDSKVAGKWGVTTLPVGGENTEARASLVAGFTWVIAANTEKTDLAKAFIEYASSSEVNSELIVADPQTGIDPNRESSLESEAYGETYPDLQRVNRTTLSGSLAWPSGENASQAAQILTDELAKLIAGEGGTAQETLDRVQAEWEEILADAAAIRVRAARTSGRVPRRAGGAALLLTAPTILSIVVLGAYPLVFVLAAAFTDSTLGRPFQEWVGTANLETILSDADVVASFVRTVVYAVIVAVTSVVLGVAIAVALERATRSGAVVRTLLLLPLITPPVVVGTLWKLVFNPGGGLLATLLPGLSLAPLSTTAWALPAVGLADVWQWTPLIVILVYAALLTQDPSVREAASLDGAHGTGLFRHITWPAIAGTVIAALFIRLVIALKVFDLVVVMTSGGPGQASTVTTYLIQQVALKEFDIGRASAITLVFAVIVTVVTLVVAVFARKARHD